MIGWSTVASGRLGRSMTARRRRPRPRAIRSTVDDACRRRRRRSGCSPVRSTASAPTPGRGERPDERRACAGRRSGSRCPVATWTRSPARSADERVLAPWLVGGGPDRHAELARGADVVLAPQHDARRPSRTWPGADGSTRRCRGRCRSASPAGTRSRSGRGRPRRSASGPARPGGRCAAPGSRRTRTSRIQTSSRSRRPPPSPSERRATGRPGSARRGARSRSQPVMPTSLNEPALASRSACATARRRRRPTARGGRGAPAVAAPTAAATGRRGRRRAAIRGAGPRPRAGSGSAPARPRLRCACGLELVGRAFAGAGRAAAAAPTRRRACGPGRGDDPDLGRGRPADAQPVRDRRVVRVERGQDDVHVGERRHATGRRRRSASAARRRTGSPRGRRTGSRSARGRGSGRRRRRGPGRPARRAGSAGPGGARRPTGRARSWPRSRTAPTTTAGIGAEQGDARAAAVDVGLDRVAHPHAGVGQALPVSPGTMRPGVVGVDGQVRVAAAGDDDLVDEAGRHEREGRRRARGPTARTAGTGRPRSGSRPGRSSRSATSGRSAPPRRARGRRARRRRRRPPRRRVAGSVRPATGPAGWSRPRRAGRGCRAAA